MCNRNERVPQPNCPYCDEPMDHIVPIFHQGDDVETFQCNYHGCPMSYCVINVKEA